jgi:hypothetical protein
MEKTITMITILLILFVGMGSAVLIADAGRIRGDSSVPTQRELINRGGDQGRITDDKYLSNTDVYLSNRLSTLLDSIYYQNNRGNFALYDLTPKKIDNSFDVYSEPYYEPYVTPTPTPYVAPIPAIPGENNEFGGCLYINNGWVCP